MPALVGFQTMVILDPNGMSFDAVCVFGPDFHLLFKSSSSYCVQFTGKLFGFPKDMKEKMIRSWQNGANKIMQQWIEKIYHIPFGNGILTFQYWKVKINLYLRAQNSTYVHTLNVLHVKVLNLHFKTDIISCMVYGRN